MASVGAQGAGASRTAGDWTVPGAARKRTRLQMPPKPDFLPELSVLGWTQAEAARHTGYSTRYISKIKLGANACPRCLRAYLTLAILLHAGGVPIP